LVAAVLIGACSETAKEPETDRLPASEIASEADEAHSASEGSVTVSDSNVNEATAGARPQNDGTSHEVDDGITPYDERVYPLSEFIGQLTDELFPGHDDEHPMVAIENSTHACMTAQGFRYAKFDWLAKEAENRARTPLISDEEYMTANGYGFADNLDAPEVIESNIVDPNDAIRDSLTQAELDAWWEQENECVDQAQREVMRHGVVRWALWDDLQRVREAVDADPRVAAALADWSSCMAGQGHPYASRDEIFAYLGRFSGPLRDRLRELGGPDNIDPAYQADLDKLHAIEVEIARADLECREPLEQVQYEVEVEHQQRYLDDNQDRLALLREELPTMTLPPGVAFY